MLKFRNFSSIANASPSLNNNSVQLEKLMSRYYDEEKREGYIPQNNHIYKERLWSLFSKIPDISTIPTHHIVAVAKIIPFTRTNPERRFERMCIALNELKERGYSPQSSFLKCALLAHKDDEDYLEKCTEIIAGWNHSPTDISLVYNILLKARAKKYGTSEAEKWLDSQLGNMIYQNSPSGKILAPLEKDEFFLSTLISCYLYENKLKSAIDKFKELLKNSPRYPERPFTKILSYFNVTKNYSESIKWFLRKDEFQITPDRLTFETILSAALKYNISSQHRMPSATEIEELFNLPFSGTGNPSSYAPRSDKDTSSALQLNEIDLKDSQLALQIIRDMINAGYKPGLQTCNIILSGYLQIKSYGTVLNIFEIMKNNLDIFADSGTYSIILKALSKLQRHNKAIELIKEIELQNIEPDMILYSTMMDCYVRAGKFDEAGRVYARLKEAGLQPSIVTFQILMLMHCLKGDINAASKVLEEIVNITSLQPTSMQYTILIHGYGLVKDVDGARETLNRMISLDIKPTVDTYNSLMYVYVVNGRPDEALQWYSEMIRAGIQPDSCTFNTMMLCFTKQENEAAALEMYKSILETGLNPSNHTVSAMTSLYAKKGLYKEATEFQDIFYEKYPKVIHNMIPHNIILQGLSKKRDLVGMVNEFERATEKYQVDAPISTFELLIKAHGSDDIKGARKWFETALVKCNHMVDSRIYATMMNIYSDVGRKEEIKNLFEDMISKGIKPNGEVNSLLEDSSI